jgi:type I restriction enzyme M protein
VANGKRGVVKAVADSPEQQETNGLVEDFISGERVAAKPEEMEAVQVFARRLVEDYGYPKAHIRTRPQVRVRRSPSDEGKSYPIDIAVFRSPSQIEDDLFLVVECKRKSKKEGLAQLKLYLDMSHAEVGVWFNGEEHVYIRKVQHKGGRRTFEELPNIPRYGQRIEDIGLYQRKDLQRPSNLKAVFRDLRNHLAGNTTGITRDEALAQEIINLLFCKIYDEINSAPTEVVAFRAGVGEKSADVRKRVIDLFEKKVKQEYNDVFTSKDSISLDDASIAYVVGELQNYCVVEADRDAVGDAFEVFIGPALRGSEGQFFTPRNVIKMMVDIVNPQPGEMIVDPACGSGGFLIGALELVWNTLEAEGKAKGWSAQILERKKRDVASKCFRGIDKDSFLARVTKAYMAIIGDGRGGVFCENSLLPPQEWNALAQEGVKLGRFDVVLTNPPFGSRIPVRGQATLAQYELGHRWKLNRETRLAERLTEIEDEQSPHILFLERCLQLLRPGGRLGIVMPESILGNPSYQYLISFLTSRTTIRAVVTMPEALFKTSGKGGTHTKVGILVLENSHSKTPQDIFMSNVKWCGHDSRGNPTYRKEKDGSRTLVDEVPLVADRLRQATKQARRRGDHLGFTMSAADVKNNILVPKYYDPELDEALRQLSKTHDLTSIGSYLDDGVISIGTGTEIGKMAYGTGSIPFVRTSDLSNWEIKADFKHGVSREIYQSERRRADLQAGDILMVRDGTYLIGTTAIVTESDLPMLYQSHLYCIRVLRPEVIDPWLLFACLNTPIVRLQVRSKQFTQDIIDTLGRRIEEIVIPLPRDKALRERIAKETRETISKRIELRNRVREIALEIEGRPAVAEDEEV